MTYRRYYKKIKSILRINIKISWTFSKSQSV